MINIMWRGYLSRSALKAHERWARRGQQGTGRLVLEGGDLRDAYVPHPHLVAARFVGCDLTGKIRNRQSEPDRVARVYLEWWIARDGQI